MEENMKKYMKVIICFSFIILSLIFVSCGQKKNNVAEKVTLDKTMLGEVEFANSEKVKIKQDDESVVPPTVVIQYDLYTHQEIGRFWNINEAHRQTGISEKTISKQCINNTIPKWSKSKTYFLYS